MSENSLDKNVLDRIQKCLSRAYHANTTEGEAKAALFVSQKLMSQHNVTQADLMVGDDSVNKACYGGNSVVTITRQAGSSTRVMTETFVDKVARAMCTLFDCKYFSEDDWSSVHWTFFGIADNTIAAAMGFEMAHNKILDYRVGVADGLVGMANREKQRELHEAKRKELDMSESGERGGGRECRQVDCLRHLPSLGVDNSGRNPFNELLGPINTDTDQISSDIESVESGDLHTTADFSELDMGNKKMTGNVDEDIDRFVKREAAQSPNPNNIPKFTMDSNSTAKLEPKQGALEQISSSPWESGMHKNNIELRHSKTRPSVVRDRDAYRQGWKDSAKINVRQCAA
ncbi:hypothetical protein N7474_004986 [Penicillium riverlandense]|uniref:uncharacterized protein n=1 Tax=Penicillium riverlandense TaxID=1903569 RepID=UPI002548BA48|nr:uncharacterized protein N7474_004986 [Penicillium riverlandense]KAJ5819395.1 hypothetical protein N7474_004986 [Penicillium riverlandense]